MITTELQQEITRYLPALTLDRLFPRFLRLRLEKILTIFIVTLFIFQGLLFGSDQLLSAIGIVEPSGILALLLIFSFPYREDTKASVRSLYDLERMSATS